MKPVPTPDSETSHPGEAGTAHPDEVLAEGLRRLEADDTTGWRQVLRAHPERAAELEQRARRLQAHGFYVGAAVSRQLGPFTLLERLGQGGMGIVHRARAAGADRDCAVKMVRPELLDGEQSRRRFRREVEAAKALTHPGIVRILDVGLDDELPWFAMELVEGTSLAELIQAARTHGTDATAAPWLPLVRGTAPPARDQKPWFEFVLRGLAQVLDALQHAHDAGITHRDLKPSNILFDASGRAVLIDFGLAHSASATTITRSGDTLGSLPYMAPELLRGGSEASVAADVYAIGATLYHALALQLPFSGANSEGIRHGILHTEPRALSSLDPNLPATIEPVWRCAMAPEPDRRYASAGAFAADLRALLDGKRTAARAPGPWLRLHRWTRRHKARAVGVASAVLFLVLLPTTLLWVQAQELRRTQRLSDLHLITELAEREGQLWPARPEIVAGHDGMDAWLAQVADLESRRARHAADLAQVRTRGRRLGPDEALAYGDAARLLQREIDSLRASMHDATTGKPGSWEDWLAELQEHEAPLVRRLDEVESYAFEDPLDARLHRNLANLLLGLDDLRVRRAKIEARRERAFAVHEASSVRVADLWRETLAELADPIRAPRYRGLTMQTQPGLVPLGRDPESGFFEFVHLLSGQTPRRDASGHLKPAPEDGLVLVLLPGGHVRVGADLDPAGPHFDPGARVEDTPSVEVGLDPFFIGKFEVTQAQWVRQRGHNNNLIKPGERPAEGAAVITSLHPADAIAHLEATRILRQWGLRLPTGAQWEYAARGGTATVLWTGSDAASLDGAENLYDFGTDTTHWRPGDDRGHMQPADPWPLHAPVGSFRANPFGLHDVLGNVVEWTLDAVRPYSQPLRDGDGCTSNTDIGSIRGAAFDMLPRACRVGARLAIEARSGSGGIRVTRPIEGTWQQGRER